MSKVKVYIDSEEICVLDASMSVRNSLTDFPTASFGYVSGRGVPIGFQEGDSVEIEYDGTAIFLGYINGLTLNEDGGTEIEWTVSCVGKVMEMERRVVHEYYNDKTAGYIVTDLITKYLSADGFTAGTIEDGRTLSRVVLNGRTCLEVVRELAAICGFAYWVDAAGALHFRVPGFDTAPFTLGDTGVTAYRSVRGEVNTDNYVNSLYVSGYGLTDTVTDSFYGDGQTKAFNTRYPVFQTPTVRLNGIAQSVGILGLSSSAEWAWSKFATEITQAETADPLTTDGRAEPVAVGVDVPFLKTIEARGRYAIASYFESGTNNRGAILFRITENSIDEVFRLPIVTDETVYMAYVGWIDDDYVLVQYYEVTPNEWTQQVYRREGDILVATSATMNETISWTDANKSNGRHMVAVRSVFMGNATVLWTYDRDAGTISETDDEPYDSGYGVQRVVMEGNYVVWHAENLTPATNAELRLFKIDPSTDTWTKTDTVTVSGAFPTAAGGMSMIGNYVFILLPISPTKYVRIYRINTATDELEYVDTWESPAWLTAMSPAVDSIHKYGNRIVLTGSFSGGDLVILKFDPETESLSVASILENTINGYVSVSQSGFGVYDRISPGDDYVRLFRFAPDLLEVEYKGTYRTAYRKRNEADIAYRQSANGGTGLWEAKESLPQERAGEVVEYARQRLAELSLEQRYSYELVAGNEAMALGLDVTQIQRVEVAGAGIDVNILITEIAYAFPGGDTMRVAVTGVDGSIYGDWSQFIRLLWGNDRRNDKLESDDFLIIPASASDIIDASDDAEVNTETITNEWNEEEWNEGEWQ